MTTMLQLVQQATAEMGIGVPASVAGNTNSAVVQILALLNSVGYEIQRVHPWQSMNKQYVITVPAVITVTGNTVAGSASITGASSIAGIDTNYIVTGTGINQGTYVGSAPSVTTIPLSQPATATGSATFTFTKIKYAMPSDYDRQINRTHWDKGRHWELLGPVTAQQWEWLQSGYISTGPRIRYRIFGNLFQLWPAPAAGTVLGFEYISNAWAANTTGTAKTAFTQDTDTCVWPDRLMVLGLKDRWYKVKGLGDVYREDYERELEMAKANDSGAQTLSMAPSVQGILLTADNLPDSGYGL